MAHRISSRSVRARSLVSAASLAAALLGAGFLVSCDGSSGGSSATVEALTLPSRIELTKVDDGSTAASSLTPNSGFGDPGTDYTQTQTRTYVEDVTQSLTIINQILGAVKECGYQYFVNKGPYSALVTPVGDDSEAPSGGATSSTTTENLEEMVVDVSRAGPDAPMIVKVWTVEQREDGTGQLIKAYFEVTRGVSDDYPMGELEAHIKGLPLDSSGHVASTTPMFTNALRVSSSGGSVTIQYIDSGSEVPFGGTFSWESKVNLLSNSDFTSGKGYISSVQSDTSSGSTSTSTHYIAFNSSYFRMKSVESSVEKAYRKTQFRQTVHRYKLFYKETGEEVDLSGGFPIQFSNGKQGYIGYYGLWAPSGVTPTSGDLVTRVGTGQQYSLFGVRGKLTKHTKSVVTLGDIVGAEIYVWDETARQDTIVTWTGTGFVKLGTRDSSGNVSYLSTPTAYAFANSWSGGWCEALKAWLPLGGLVSPTNATQVSYHTDQTVFPGQAGNLTLYYFGFALDTPITQSVIDGAATARNNYWSSGITRKTYYFDPSAMVLRDGSATGEPVILGSGLDLSSSEYANGYYMDPLTADSSFTTSNWEQIYNEQTYYSWCTGPKDWNQFWTLKDSTGNYVTFDPPIRLTYTHTTANDRNGDSTYDGKKFSLDYDGSELHVPGKFNPTLNRWVPLINLKDGTVLQDSSGTEYVVKAVEVSLSMVQETDASVLSTLDSTLPFDESVGAPGLTYSDAKNSNMGDMPTGTTLKVVKGELVSGT